MPVVLTVSVRGHLNLTLDVAAELGESIRWEAGSISPTMFNEWECNRWSFAGCILGDSNDRYCLHFLFRRKRLIEWCFILFGVRVFSRH